MQVGKDHLEELVNMNNVAGQWLERFFKNDKPSEKDFKKARIATSHRATQIRAHGTQIAQDKQRFSLARVIFDDKDKLAQYLNASLPKARLPVPKPSK